MRTCETGVDCVARRFEADAGLMASAEYLDLCRGDHPECFTRNRKMPARDLTLAMIGQKGRSCHMEVRGFMNKHHPEAPREDRMTKQGCLKQRMKLNPEAIECLWKHHTGNSHADPGTGLDTFNGYLVLAVDGSCANVDTNEETMEACGDPKGRVGDNACAQVGLACLHDSLNETIVDLDC